MSSNTRPASSPVSSVHARASLLSEQSETLPDVVLSLIEILLKYGLDRADMAGCDCTTEPWYMSSWYLWSLRDVERLLNACWRTWNVTEMGSNVSVVPVVGCEGSRKAYVGNLS